MAIVDEVTQQREAHHQTTNPMLALVPQGDWILQAICSQVDNEMFFPDKGGSSNQAKAVCQRCPVRAECLEYALANNERFGIWGGKSERERRKLSATTYTVPCPDDDCELMFANKGNAARHAEMAHRDHFAICPDCGRDAGTQAGLTLHTRAAHPAAS